MIPLHERVNSLSMVFWQTFADASANFDYFSNCIPPPKLNWKHFLSRVISGRKKDLASPETSAWVFNNCLFWIQLICFEYRRASNTKLTCSQKNRYFSANLRIYVYLSPSVCSSSKSTKKVLCRTLRASVVERKEGQGQQKDEENRPSLLLQPSGAVKAHYNYKSK